MKRETHRTRCGLLVAAQTLESLCRHRFFYSKLSATLRLIIAIGGGVSSVGDVPSAGDGARSIPLPGPAETHTP